MGNKKWKTYAGDNKKYIYVIYIDKDMPDGKKKQFLGPYAEKHAESIMLDCLREGHCAWIEKRFLRERLWRSKPEAI